MLQSYCVRIHFYHYVDSVFRFCRVSLLGSTFVNMYAQSNFKTSSLYFFISKYCKVKQYKINKDSLTTEKNTEYLPA